MKLRLAFWFPCCLLVASALQAENGPEAESAQLQARIVALEARLAQVEARWGVTAETSLPAPDTSAQTAAAAPAQAVAAAAVPAPTSWTERLEWDGDLRYRHETIDEQGLSVRHRHRMRARANVRASVNDKVMLRLGLASGGDANDSGNVSFDNAFSRKSFGLDLAYVDWQLTDPLTLLAGKMANPFIRPGGSHLLFDGDLRPEGLAFQVNTGNLFATASAFWTEERSSDPDTLWYGAQAGYRGSPTEGLALTAGASFHKLSHIQGRSPLFTPDRGQGNQLDADGNYLYGFSLLELFGEARIELAGLPLRLFADYVTNTEADALADGLAFGVEYRHRSPAGAWRLGYAWQDLEANAVVGAFTDSDFAGGATDGSGHTLRARYAFPDGWRLDLRYIISERGKASPNPRNYNRLQADIRFDF